MYVRLLWIQKFRWWRMNQVSCILGQCIRKPWYWSASNFLNYMFGYVMVSPTTRVLLLSNSVRYFYQKQKMEHTVSCLSPDDVITTCYHPSYVFLFFLHKGDYKSSLCAQLSNQNFVFIAWFDVRTCPSLCRDIRIAIWENEWNRIFKQKPPLPSSFFPSCELFQSLSFMLCIFFGILRVANPRDKDEEREQNYRTRENRKKRE
jgi:hypothetical protein